ncbi:MAG: type II secretion system secretin GspD [Desulfocapsa sp.]|nr:type II secretion system secretin GspD [Desulfocapsa sp.]
MICRLPMQVLQRSKILALILCCCILTITPCSTMGAEKSIVAPPPSKSVGAGKRIPPPQKSTSQRFITIDFDNVDIRLFIKYISELTGKNFIVDKTVKGEVSIISPTRISEDEAFKVFESVLSVNGFTTVPAGAMIKIMPTVRARTENIDTIHHGKRSEPEDKIVTQLIPLTHTTPEAMKKVLAPLTSKTSVVIAHTESGMLIVTDTLSNIQKLLSIIKALDVDYAIDEMEVLLLNYATASKLATTINSIFNRKTSAQKGASPVNTITVVPYDRINAMIILAGPGDILRVKRLVAMLDTEPEQDEGNIQVVYLQHARAKELATVLTSLPTADKTSATTKGAPTKTPSRTTTSTISKDVKIMADEETNALIITASRAEFKTLDNVIKKLDIPRRMVYLEALILEVDTESNFDVGVKWIGGGTFADDTGAVLFGSGGSDGIGMGDAITVDGDGNAFTGRGFTMGVLKTGIEIAGITFPNIAAVLKAYKDDSDINIIATPQILTTDNKQAEISVGQNIPYLSTANTADSSERGYENYEYKDVATKLTITPQINQADTLRLEIATEVSKIKTLGDTGVTPTTFKRTANTTVLVQDGDTIVIGGIIDHDASEGESKIPLLGDIPFLGWLFKSHSTSHRKTNMFIFVTPHIIKNPADIARVTLTKEEQIGKVLPGVKEQLHRQINLDHAMSLSDIGFQKLQTKDYTAAKDYFNEALDINPKSPYALMNLGVIYENEGDPKKAISYYQQVIDNAVDTGDGEVEGAGPTGRSLQKICRENIDRLMQTQDTWPYPQNSDK